MTSKKKDAAMGRRWKVSLIAGKSKNPKKIPSQPPIAVCM